MNLCIKEGTPVNEVQEVNEQSQCPECKSSIPHYPPYTMWCHHCGWNLQPGQEPPSGSIYQRFYTAVSAKANQRLLGQMLNKGRTPQFSYARVGAILLASFVYLSVIASTAYAFYHISQQNLIQSVIGSIISLLLISSIVPRFEPHPPEIVLTRGDEFPQINQLIEQIAAALGIDMPSVMMTAQFTATFGRIGWKQRPLLILGHPFLAILNEHELVSLIAHELAHSIDGSVTRSLFVRIPETAMKRLCCWLNPFYVFRNHLTPIFRVLLIPISIPIMILSLPIQLITYFFMLCNRRDRQRAEYVADYLSATISGNVNTPTLLHKSLFGYLPPLQIAYDRADHERKYAAVCGQVKRVPEREFDRLWRIATQTPPDIIGTHPPVKERVNFLRNIPTKTPEIALTDTQFEEIKIELAKWPVVMFEREVELINSQNAQALSEFIQFIGLPVNGEVRMTTLRL